MKDPVLGIDKDLQAADVLRGEVGTGASDLRKGKRGVKGGGPRGKAMTGRLRTERKG